MTALRVVLDTNVVLDCFVFRDPGVSVILAALRDRSARLVTDSACTSELERVLGYARLRLDLDARRALMAEYRGLATPFDGLPKSTPLPVCRDADDQKFLALARDAEADFLITKDHALLMLAKPCYRVFKIISPSSFGAVNRPFLAAS